MCCLYRIKRKNKKTHTGEFSTEIKIEGDGWCKKKIIANLEVYTYLSERRKHKGIFKQTNETVYQQQTYTKSPIKRNYFFTLRKLF